MQAEVRSAAREGNFDLEEASGWRRRAHRNLTHQISSTSSETLATASPNIRRGVTSERRLDFGIDSSMARTAS